MGRFCTTEDLDNATPLSTLRGRDFMRNDGVEIASGPLAGLTARAVVVLDEDDVVRHVELVPEVRNEPNYDAALKALAQVARKFFHRPGINAGPTRQRSCRF